ncbi:MAG: CHAT domain-containing protein [Acidobacteriia bacterium]|nr:CHAT domain-containing protein [Terriglobia bacterium]
MIRAIVVILLAVSCFADDTPVWISRTHRKVFDQLMTDGRYREADANARAVLADAEAKHGPESLEAALACEMLLEVYFYGNYVRDPEAEQAGFRALALKEKILGPEHSEVAVTLRLLGDLYTARADYERARGFFERAVAIHEKSTDQLMQQANALRALGSLLAKSGEFAAARSAFERAAAIREKNFPPETLNTAVTLSDYAVLLRETGEYEASRAKFLRAVQIFEKKMGPDHVIITECLTEYGSLLNKMGLPAEAKAVLERALAIEEKTYGPSQVDLAFVLSRLATASMALGELERAQILYERALAIAEGVYGPDHPEVARILGGYAGLLLKRGNRAGALAAALRTERIGREHLLATIRMTPERQALRYAATRATALDLMLGIALEDPAARAPVYDALMRSRALVFDEIAARHRAMTGSGDAEIARLAELLAAARTALARLVVQGPARFAPGEYASALARANDEKDRAERALAERNAPFQAEMDRRSAGAKEVFGSLVEGDALVSFVRFGSEPAYMAFVERAGDASPHAILLGPAARIEKNIAALRGQIEAQAESPGRAEKLSESKYRETGTILRREIWDPIEPSLAGARRVFLAPDNALNLVDFAALPDRAGGYLVERAPLLHYVSAERDLISRPQKDTGRGLLALGAPAFDRTPHEAAPAGEVFRGGRSTCAGFRSMHFDPLPATFREVKEIGAVWGKTGSGGVIERTGERANGNGFKQDAPGRRVVHVAAHGFFLSGACPSSSVEAMGENPLLLSGLALAGANRRDQAEDGILTAEEIASLDLHSVEWAVLSACETGVGKMLAGEGVFGLRRAFQVAGTHTVITSLWPVSDDATEQWMSALYRKRLVNRLNTPESVRAASLETLGRRREKGLSTHPFYWAGFIAVGDWR